ncbi:serine/threonine-protein kinase [Nocardia sp. NPDC049707]|uniref:serine/threonine protein kinase n=1 Tax=Nocardia sp. NPDC049707 TaxID=3154735 RepID=UPI00342DBDE6
MAQLDIGSTFADFAIEGVLGRGGMGSVYLARHPRLPRQLALKLLNREVCADPEMRRRFEQEASVVARMEHPGIVGIYDRGIHDEQLWIAMQYIHGTDAAQLSPDQLTIERVLRILTGCAAALDYAHSRAVLHRDIKPANILLAAPETGLEERPVLTDFGIARVLGATSQVTATGTVTATLAFAAPEQLASSEVDHRTDQYSLACTLFTLLAHRTPFDAEHPAQVIAGHLSMPAPPLTRFRPDLPPALDQVLARGMAKECEQRFDSCVEFAAAAQDALQGRPSAETTRTTETIVVPGHPTASQQATTARNFAAPPTEIDAGSPMVAQTPSAAMASTQTSPGSLPAGAIPSTVIPGTPPPARPPRKARGRRALIIELVTIVTVTLFVGYVAYDSMTPGWSSDEQRIAAAFPKLVPGKPKQPGWHDTTCQKNYDKSQKAIIDCVSANEDFSLTLRYFDTAEAAAKDIQLPGGNAPYPHEQLRTEIHPDVPEPMKLVFTDPNEYRSGIYAGFSMDSDRNRFTVEIKYTAHSNDDQKLSLWKSMPLGK